jgi:hypothetical protein
MTFLSHTSSRRRLTARARISLLRDAVGKLTFLLAVGFSAAVVFGLIGR